MLIVRVKALLQQLVAPALWLVPVRSVLPALQQTTWVQRRALQAVLFCK